MNTVVCSTSSLSELNMIKFLISDMGVPFEESKKDTEFILCVAPEDYKKVMFELDGK